MRTRMPIHTYTRVCEAILRMTYICTFSHGMYAHTGTDSDKCKHKLRLCLNPHTYITHTFLRFLSKYCVMQTTVHDLMHVTSCFECDQYSKLIFTRIFFKNHGTACVCIPGPQKYQLQACQEYIYNMSEMCACHSADKRSILRGGIPCLCITLCFVSRGPMAPAIWNRDPRMKRRRMSAHAVATVASCTCKQSIAECGTFCPGFWSCHSIAHASQHAGQILCRGWPTWLCGEQSLEPSSFNSCPLLLGLLCGRSGLRYLVVKLKHFSICHSLFARFFRWIWRHLNPL
jgi:hypothetical protein